MIFVKLDLFSEAFHLMDNTNRMMHYPQGFGMGMGDQLAQPTSPQPQEEVGAAQHPLEGQEGMRGTASINTILDQIMSITDQSLDEAQVFLCHFLLDQTF